MLRGELRKKVVGELFVNCSWNVERSKQPLHRRNVSHRPQASLLCLHAPQSLRSMPVYSTLGCRISRCELAVNCVNWPWIANTKRAVAYVQRHLPLSCDGPWAVYEQLYMPIFRLRKKNCISVNSRCELTWVDSEFPYVQMPNSVVCAAPCGAWDFVSVSTMVFLFILKFKEKSQRV